jgi:hypothetical protein
LNYDGAIGFADLVLLAQRYNTTLPAPAQPVVSAEPVLAAATSTPAKSLFSLTPLKKPRRAWHR